MSFHITYLPYDRTGAFTPLVTDYLAAKDPVKPFYRYAPDIDGIRKAICERTNYPVDREQLVTVLEKQYEGLHTHPAVTGNLKLLLQENTFTVCTAHQPNLLTGYLYFVYKIIHAIRLAENLGKQYPEQRFVPVYYMGSEDNDLDELGTFRYRGKKFVWDAAGQSGAVGRMNTTSLKPLLEDLFRLLGPPGQHAEEMKRMITEAYQGQETVAAATQHFVNELFGKYGLIVLDPDNAELKRSFIPVMKDDLLRHTAFDIVSAQMARLSDHYKVQAHPRPVNLFYLREGLRERIEHAGDRWKVLQTDIAWTQEEMCYELEHYPERFSPNVILRGLYQETILPNVAFIGGGAEVAYWLQIKAVFDHYGVFFPAVHLRQSALWIDNGAHRLRDQLGLELHDLFLQETAIIHQFVLRNSDGNWQTDQEIKMLEQVMAELRQKAVQLDPTLGASADAALTRIRHQVQRLEKKMLRAEKRRLQDQILRIGKLKQQLFPNGLQERVENFLDYYLQYGPGYFDLLKDHMQPIKQQFLVIEER